MRLRLSTLLTIVSIAIATLSPVHASAQMPLVTHWEKIGPVNFTALVQQSPTQIVAATDHGYLYITNDEGVTWQRREVSDSIDINGLSFGDSLHGALIATGNLMLTSDGGVTWQEHSAPWNGSLVMVGALGADTLIIGASVFIGDTLRGKIFRSTDAGANWDTVFTTDTSIYYWQAPMKIDFFFGSGYAIGPGFYAKTTDAGAHWSAQYLQLGGDLRDIDFWDQSTGAIAGTAGYYVTTDGGTNWAFTPVFHDERDDSYMAVKFFGPTNFFLFGNPNPYYYVSNDLGATVALTQMPEANSISNVVRTPSGTWLAVGGGIDQNGYPYGGGGYILQATYSQESMTSPAWTVVAECPCFSNVNFHATNGALLQVTAGSYPLYSTDSGFFWHEGNSIYSGFSGMHFSSSDTGYLFGSNSMITTDSGQSWRLHDVGNANISNVSFGSNDIGFGVSGSVVRTTDGGESWAPDSIPYSSTSPYSGYTVDRTSISVIAAADGADAFVLTRVEDTQIVRSGKNISYKIHYDVYKTTNAGTDWTKLTTFPSTQTISEMYFKNASLGFLISDSAHLYRTSDGGNTWMLETPVQSEYKINSVNFLNERIGFLTVDSEAVLATTDGGLNWNWFPIPTNREEIINRQDVFIVPPDTIPNLSGMNMQGIFFPDSTTVLISYIRALVNITVPPKDTVINGDTIVEFNPNNYGAYVNDYGFYRAKLNIAPQSAVLESQSVSGADEAISLYPNPARNEIHVALEGTSGKMATLEIFNMLGEPVLSVPNPAGTISLDVHSLPNGIYMIRYSSLDNAVSKIFTIER